MLIDRLLSSPQIYRLWQAPFVRGKLRPLMVRIDATRAGRVLDVGCGPGTNASFFEGPNYVGVDLSPIYIDYARRRYQGRFEVWDITKPRPSLGTFDTVLINSVFHHLSDEETTKVLSVLPSYLNEEGSVFIIDLVLPKAKGLPRLLARLDRGQFPRPIDRWLEIFSEHFHIRHTEAFSVGIVGVSLWELVFVDAGVRTAFT